MPYRIRACPVPSPDHAEVSQRGWLSSWHAASSTLRVERGFLQRPLLQGGASSSALPPGTQNPDAKLSGVLVLSSARKRAFRRAQNRATRAGATFYRGKWVTSHQLQAAAGELRSSHCRARTTSKPLATLGNLAAWPPGPKSRASTFRRALAS